MYIKSTAPYVFPQVNNFTKPSSKLIDSFINLILWKFIPFLFKYAPKKIFEKYTFYFFKAWLKGP